MNASRRKFCKLYKWFVAILALMFPRLAAASFLHGEALDKAADVMAIVVICIVPIIGVVVFWLVHIIPEKIAEKRHHPQKDAINMLCMLSLVFGGLLWPLAWLWAYTKPVGYKLAYGRDKHDDYYKEEEEKEEEAKTKSLKAEEAKPVSEPSTKAGILGLTAKTPVPEKKTNLEDDVRVLREKLAAMEAQLASLQAKELPKG